MSTTKKRGIKDITAERQKLLNGGAQTTTLTECLAVDFAELIKNILPEIDRYTIDEIRANASTGILKRMVLVAQLIMDRLGPLALERLAQHPSDTARGWACFMIGQAGNMDLSTRLAAIRPYANDTHFGVREWSWMAVRTHLASELPRAIALLTEWTTDPSDRVRRFATEAIRPRGVWCSHIAVLKQQPAIALPVLEPLRADQSIYVQDSVANWLNDASKDNADWVQALCSRWHAEKSTPETTRICKRGLRSIHPNL